ncbi:SGNH/GDSL hydrolase family protein [Providencia rettgeri]|uniref:SGNH/GDSL hydrolase family protein n=1 Tax=Providencia rettgeri TaxID=587 RepID=UPI0025522B77|nr:SGNH/GDSL hydrolase family protein [Providencia rettgeri]
MTSIYNKIKCAITHRPNSTVPDTTNLALKNIVSIKNQSPQSTSNNIGNYISVGLNDGKTKGQASFHNMKELSGDDVDGSLLGRHTEKRIPGKPFQLAIAYSNKFNIEKKEAITCFDSVTVIGDSLSDSEGRMYKKSGGLLTNANQYHDGRFTNGFTWPEFLTMPNTMKSHSSKGKVTLTNKSEGGSACVPYFKSTLHPQFAILSNIEKQTKHLKFDEKSLGIIFLGANDYMTYSKENVDVVISSQEKTIKKMIKNGARNILVMGLPDLSQTPAIKTCSPKKQRKIQNLSIEHNNKLQTLVNLLKLNKNININYFNVNDVMKNITNIVDDINKNSLGAYNKEKAFTNGYILRDNSKPLEIDPHYIFIDDVHPTQEVHNILAMELHNFILKKYQPLKNQK